MVWMEGESDELFDVDLDDRRENEGMASFRVGASAFNCQNERPHMLVSCGTKKILARREGWHFLAFEVKIGCFGRCRWLPEVGREFTSRHHEIQECRSTSSLLESRIYIFSAWTALQQNDDL